LARGWASKISNLPNVVTSQIFNPTNNGELLSDLSKTANRLSGEAKSTRDTATRIRLERAVDDSEELIKQIEQNNEIIGYMTYLTMVIGRNEVELEKNCRRFEATIATLNCKARLLNWQMEEAFKTISPWGWKQFR